MPLNNSQVIATISGDYSTALDLGTALLSSNISRGTKFTTGTGAGQVDKIFTDTRTLGASASEDLDLAGVLLDAFGATITFARVRGILVAANPANTNNVVVGANVTSAMGTLIGPTGASGGTITLRPGAMFCACCGSGDATGYAVTATSADLIHVTNSAAGSSVTYDIVVIGASV